MIYSYYIGFKKDGKIYPLGLYNSFFTLCPVLQRSENFASKLHERFNLIKENMYSDELKKEFEGISFLEYLPVDELPLDTYIKSGYFLIEEVKKFEESKDDFFEFSEFLLPRFYAAKLQMEMMFGFKESAEKRGEKSVADYMFYTYPDYRSEEFEARLIHVAAEALNMTVERIEKEDLVAILLKSS